MVIFIVIPLLLFLYYGFTIPNDSGGVKFSLANFMVFFTNAMYLQVFWRSIYLSIISTFICLIIGYPMALILSSKTFRNKNVLIFLLVVPMWMNFLLRTYAWLTILENTGLLNTVLSYFGFEKGVFLYNENAIILGMVYNYLPFMILPIYSVLIKIEENVIEAAKDLGADSICVFKKIIFPLSIYGVISGITMVFMPSVTTFAISSILSGRKIHLIGNLIEEQFIGAYNWHFGSTLSIILLVLILISISFISRFEKENEGGGLI